MRSRYRVSFGGVQMDTLDDNLLILNIGHSQPDRNIKKQTVANLDGYDISDEYTGQRTVTVTFELHIYDPAKRNAACQKVNEWASATGTLVTSDRSGQQLMNVVCEQFADIESARDWTDPLTIVFATTENPCWRSTKTNTLSITGKSASGTLKMDGNIKSALVYVNVTAAEAITSLQLTVGSTTLKLTGISIPAGKKVAVSYTNNRYLKILGNGKSVMNKLDPSSSDNLLAECGKDSKASVTANGKVTAVFTGRGCWR